MRYLIAAHTDVGIKKKTNQDSYMIKEAQTKMGRIFFGVLCDGMGGLSNGELASATVIRAMEQWFDRLSSITCAYNGCRGSVGKGKK